MYYFLKAKRQLVHLTLVSTCHSGHGLLNLRLEPEPVTRGCDRVPSANIPAVSFRVLAALFTGAIAHLLFCYK